MISFNGEPDVKSFVIILSPGDKAPNVYVYALLGSPMGELAARTG